MTSLIPVTMANVCILYAVGITAGVLLSRVLNIFNDTFAWHAATWYTQDHTQEAVELVEPRPPPPPARQVEVPSPPRQVEVQPVVRREARPVLGRRLAPDDARTREWPAVRGGAAGGHNGR